MGRPRKHRYHRCAAILDVVTPEELARAMYRTHYFEGHRKDDPEGNIRDYAAAIARHIDPILAALSLGRVSHSQAL